jgi:hypothetical protein
MTDAARFQQRAGRESPGIAFGLATNHDQLRQVGLAGML